MKRLSRNRKGFVRTGRTVGLAAMLVLTGCASPRDRDLERIRDVFVAPTATNTTTTASALYVGPDTPDSPDTTLPVAGGGGFDDRALGLTIQKDCLLQIRVAEDPALTGTYPVNDIGAVMLGYVGPVILFNKTEQEAELKIKEILESRGAFKSATVSVKIQRASYDNIRVSGAVAHPGIIQIGAGDAISLNDAILRAGGLSAAVVGTKVRIVRSGLKSAVSSALDGESYTLEDDSGKPRVPEVLLRNNDIAHVESQKPVELERGGAAGKAVLVLGEVNRRGFYGFSAGEPATIMNLMLKMGGLPAYANDKAIKIIRRDREGRESEIVVNARRILDRGDPEFDVPLEDGDRIIVPARRIMLF